MKNEKPEWLLKNFVTVAEFAKIKVVQRTSVYHAINHGKIKVNHVGRSKAVYIDLAEYKDYAFKEQKNVERPTKKVKIIP